MFKRVMVCAAVTLVSAACAARAPGRPVELSAREPGAQSVTRRESLEAFIGKVRTLSAEARPTKSSPETIEASDPALAAALFQLALSDTAQHRHGVADQYARLGIMDKAHEHLAAAVRDDPRDAATWDRIARLWRDSGFPHLGLGDAYRALYFAPRSPIVHNTVGTLLQALGRHKDARARYEAALTLDPTAVYALNNLCYSKVLEGQASDGAQVCRRALELQPGLAAARNNLGLAYAASGNLNDAEQAFAASGQRGRAQYNLGIVHLARRQYSEAARAFEEAQKIRPGFHAAEVMARQARSRANGEDSHDDQFAH
jgi:tetratricopeptide (TPR) repeat protein